MPSSVSSNDHFQRRDKRSRINYEGASRHISAHNNDGGNASGRRIEDSAGVDVSMHREAIRGDNDDDNYADYQDNAVAAGDDCDDLSVVTNDGEQDEPFDDNRMRLLDKRHYRNMEFDKDAGHFVYKKDDMDAQEGIPKIEDYLQKSPKDMKEIRVTFGLSRRRLLEVLKQEYDIFHQRCNTLKIPLDREGIYEYLFGRESQLMMTLRRELKLDLPDIYTFLATFYFAAEFRTTPKRLQEHSSVNYDGYMDSEQVNAIWNLIADTGKNGETPTYLWECIEDSLNSVCRNLFVVLETIRRFLVAWDDDKVHLHYSTTDARSDPHFLCGLLGFQHQKANCRGFTIDSAISPATGFPLSFRARRQGETDHQCYETMLRYMFAYLFTVAGASNLALDGIIFCSDRGYWTPALILLILGYGGTVFGTLKRNYWVPFTYNQKRQDKRTQIETKYGRSIFVAFARWGRYLLKIMAWRGGTGNVSLAMNSECSDDEIVTMEFKLKNSADMKWYGDKELSKDQRKLKAFHPIEGIEVSDKNLEYIHTHIQHTLKVIMLTVSDLGYMWFNLRTFALTSSSVAFSIRNVAPHLSSSEASHPNFVNVLGYAGLSDLLGSLTRTTTSDAMSDEDHDDEEVMVIDSALVRKVMKLMRRPTQITANNCANIVSRIKVPLRSNTALDDLTLRGMVAELGVDAARAQKLPRDKMKTLIRSWITSIESVRSVSDDTDFSDEDSEDCSDFVIYNFPYDKLQSAEVTALLLARAGSALRKGELPGDLQHPSTKDERILVLQTIDNHPTFNSNQNSNDAEHDPVRDAILKGIIQRSFLKPLDGQDKAATRLGHQNESLYLKQFESDSKRGKVPNMNPLCIQRCGMAMHEKMSFVRDTADGIFFELKNEDDDIESSDDDSSIGYSSIDPIKSHPVECKSRSGSGHDGSLMQAKLIRTKIARKIGVDADIAIARGDAIYLEVSSSDQDLLKQLIPSSAERIQILHHAFTYGANKTSFLVGNPHGKLLFGLIVTFEPDLLRDYGKVLQYIYDNGLEMFYGETVDDVPVELVENILMSDSSLKKKYTIDDFMTQLLLCRECLPNSNSKVLHPIPECSLSVPLDYGMWNSSKGGSDTVTQLIWKCLPVLPIKSPQTVIVARYFMNFAVVKHRAVQSFGGTKDIDLDEDTIESVRNRNNKRRPFHESIRWLHNRLRRSASEELRRMNTPAAASMQSNANETFLYEEPPRFNRRQPDATRIERNHEILNSADVTGLTPVGRGKSKTSASEHEKYGDVLSRNNKCVGCVVRLYDDTKPGKKKRKSGFGTKSLICDLCGSRGVSTFCVGCKRALCFDADRSMQLYERLRGKDGDRLRREYPALSSLSRGDVPAYYCQVGQVNGVNITVGRSCFHIAHPHLFSPHAQDDNDIDMDDVDTTGEADHISRIANSSYSTSPVRGDHR